MLFSKLQFFCIEEPHYFHLVHSYTHARGQVLDMKVEIKQIPVVDVHHCSVSLYDQAINLQYANKFIFICHRFIFIMGIC